MQQDRYGNALGTSSAAAAADYDEGVAHVLAATFGGEEAFARAVAADEGFALGHIGAARAAMYGGDMAAAKAFMAKAEGLVDGISAREAAHVAIFTLLLAGKAAEVRRAVFAHVKDYPRDVLVSQICTNVFGLIGMSGEVGREAMQLAFTTSLMRDLGEDWWLLSVHGQAVCEVGRLDEAMQLLERSLQLNNANANASHFKAHTLYEQGEAVAGQAYLSDWMAGYDRRAVLHGHMAWHEALWALGQGDVAGMWHHYHDAIAPGASHSLPINVITDGAALLWRAEMAGVAVAPDEWQRVSAYAAQYFPNPGQSFADIHAALAHAMAGDGVALARVAEATQGFAAALVQPVARAWEAVARGDWTTALRELTPVMSDHARFGGSKAQRDLLELTWLLCLMRTGARDEAKRAAATRRPLFAQAAPVAGFA